MKMVDDQFVHDGREKSLGFVGRVLSPGLETDDAARYSRPETQLSRESRRKDPIEIPPT